MYCENCGVKLEENSSVCPKCNHKNNFKSKNVFIALILSIIITGLGTVYAGNTKKGLIILASRLLCVIIEILLPIFLILNILIWIYGIYDAYHETQKTNGIQNPNLIKDLRKSNSYTKIIAIIIIAFVLIVSISGIISMMIPSYEPTSSNSHTYYTTSSSGSSHYGGVDNSPSTIARNDPDWYYDHYDYGDNDEIDEYLESQGYD